MRPQVTGCRRKPADAPARGAGARTRLGIMAGIIVVVAGLLTPVPAVAAPPRPGLVKASHSVKVSVVAATSNRLGISPPAWCFRVWTSSTNPRWATWTWSRKVIRNVETCQASDGGGLEYLHMNRRGVWKYQGYGLIQWKNCVFRRPPSPEVRADLGCDQYDPPSGLREMRGPSATAMKAAALTRFYDPDTPLWCLTAYRTLTSWRWGTVLASERATSDGCGVPDGDMKFLHRKKGSRSWRHAGGWKSATPEAQPEWCRFRVPFTFHVWRDFGCADHALQRLIGGA